MRVSTRIQNRQAVTLIELLVVIGIVGILIGIIIPSVQMARQSARHMSCKNNMRQISLGVHNYTSVHNCFPPSMLYEVETFGKTSCPVCSIQQYSLFTRILPGIELLTIYNQINFSVSLTDLRLDRSYSYGLASNSTVMKLNISTFQCPSETKVYRGVTAYTNYRVNVGSHWWIVNMSHQNLAPCGIEVLKKFKSNIASITDGLSSTVLASEKIIGTDYDSSFRSDRYIALPDDPQMSYGADNQVVISVCEAKNSYHRGYYTFSGLSWMVGNLIHGSYNHVLTPNSNICDCILTGIGPQPGIISARSNHPGGVNVSMADGSVRFVKNSISRQVWQAIGTKAGGETISDEDF